MRGILGAPSKKKEFGRAATWVTEWVYIYFAAPVESYFDRSADKVLGINELIKSPSPWFTRWNGSMPGKIVNQIDAIPDFHIKMRQVFDIASSDFARLFRCKVSRQELFLKLEKEIDEFHAFKSERARVGVAHFESHSGKLSKLEIKLIATSDQDTAAGKTELSFKNRCLNCLGPSLKADGDKDDRIVSCLDCGQKIGTLGDLRDAALKLACDYSGKPGVVGHYY